MGGETLLGLILFVISVHVELYSWTPRDAIPRDQAVTEIALGRVLL